MDKFPIFLLDNFDNKEIFRGSGCNGDSFRIEALNFSALIKNKLIIAISAALLLIILFLIFDSLKTSSELSEEKFVEVYVQFSIASEMYGAEQDKLEEERRKILEKYNVTQEEIDLFIKEYNKNPEKWARVWERIVRRLEEQKAKFKESFPE